MAEAQEKKVEKRKKELTLEEIYRKPQLFELFVLYLASKLGEKPRDIERILREISRGERVEQKSELRVRIESDLSDLIPKFKGRLETGREVNERLRAEPWHKLLEGPLGQLATSRRTRRKIMRVLWDGIMSISVQHPGRVDQLLSDMKAVEDMERALESQPRKETEEDPLSKLGKMKEASQEIKTRAQALLEKLQEPRKEEIPEEPEGIEPGGAEKEGEEESRRIESGVAEEKGETIEIELERLEGLRDRINSWLQEVERYVRPRSDVIGQDRVDEFMELMNGLPKPLAEMSLQDKLKNLIAFSEQMTQIFGKLDEISRHIIKTERDEKIENAKRKISEIVGDLMPELLPSIPIKVKERRGPEEGIKRLEGLKVVMDRVGGILREVGTTTLNIAEAIIYGILGAIDDMIRSFGKR